MADRTFRPAGIAYVVDSATAVGAMAIFARYAYADGVDTATLLALRFVIAGALLIGTCAIAGVACYVLYGTFQRISVADVIRNMASVPRERLLLAAGCVLGVFSVLATYEVVAVRYVKHCIGRAKPVITALVAFPLGHALGQTGLSGSALRYRMYSPAGFSAMEVGATVLLCGLPYALAFGLLLDLALVFAPEQLAPLFRISAGWLFTLRCIGLAKDAAYLLFMRDAWSRTCLHSPRLGSSAVADAARCRSC